MLTVKIVGATGIESLVLATNVYYLPAGTHDRFPEYDKDKPLIQIHTPDRIDYCSYGTVYVMNEYGQTVSKYNVDPDTAALSKAKRLAISVELSRLRKAEIAVVSSVRYAVGEIRMQKTHSAITRWLDFIDKCLDDYMVATKAGEEKS